jgi:hypothetical protein
MKEIIKEVIKVIDSLDLGYPVFFYEKDDDVTYPFIIIKMPTTTKIENYRQDYNLTVDIWTQDQMLLFDLTDSIDEGLDRYKFLGSDVQFNIYSTGRLNNIKDSNISIARNQLKFTIKAYKLG